jgi:spermidine dehydrogenase
VVRPARPQAGAAWRTKQSLLATNHALKSPSRRAGDQSDEKNVIVRGALKLLQTPFSDYESSLKDDLSRIMRGSKFDFDRDVSAIFLYRWGHSMFMPTPNFLFGKTRKPDGTHDRTKAPRTVACSPLGSIFFAGQHREGTPSVESAISSGHRAALEVLARL